MCRSVPLLPKMFKDETLILYRSLDPCFAHHLHRVGATCSDEKDEVGHTHVVLYISSLANKRAALLQVVRNLIDEELVVAHSEPHDLFLEQIRRVLRHTMQRTISHVRGSISDGWSVTGC